MTLIFLFLSIALIVVAIYVALKKSNESHQVFTEEKYLKRIGIFESGYVSEDIDKKIIDRIFITPKIRNKLWLVEKNISYFYSLVGSFISGFLIMATIIYLLGLFQINFLVPAYLVAFIFGYVIALFILHSAFIEQKKEQIQSLLMYFSLVVLNLRSGKSAIESTRDSTKNIDSTSFKRLCRLLPTEASSVDKFSDRLKDLGEKSDIEDIKELAILFKLTEDIGIDQTKALESAADRIEEISLQNIEIESKRKTETGNLSQIIIMIAIVGFIMYPLIGSLSTSGLPLG